MTGVAKAETISQGVRPVNFLVDSADVSKLREAVSKIAGAGYSENSIKKRLGLDDLGTLQWRSIPIYRSECLADRDPLALAIELFLFQGTLTAHELDRLFAGSECDVLSRTGILEIDELGRTRARASLFPVGDRLIFSDHAWPQLSNRRCSATPFDQVMWVGLDSRFLARCTIRRPFHAALDLCTGSGVHALLAAAHTEMVLAVDINPRAVACARFNAQSSGIANLDVAVGDLYEPARGRSFDLITANPPFVPSPFDNLLFRDGGRSGEDIQKRIIAGLPNYLAPGGIAQVVTELGECREESLGIRIRQWLNGAPMDIHILRLGEYTAAKYATGHAQGDDYDAYLASVDEWASNLRAQNYLRVVSVVITFQWSDPVSGAPWDRVDESCPPSRYAGAEIDAVFCTERFTRHADWQEVLKRSWLARTGSIALLDAHVLGSDVRGRAKACLLGQALKIDHQLDPVEREILAHLKGRSYVPDLIKVFCDLGVEEKSFLVAARSLLRRRLVGMDSSSASVR
jgi:methylase of polypeptide subunit release factors